jgi:hypothetical protein
VSPARWRALAHALKRGVCFISTRLSIKKVFFQRNHKGKNSGAPPITRKFAVLLCIPPLHRFYDELFDLCVKVLRESGWSIIDGPRLRANNEFNVVFPLTQHILRSNKETFKLAG